MKIIFLDVDGVLNCPSTKARINGYIGVEQDKISLVKQIVEATEAKIVLSSTWRLDIGIHEGHVTYNYLVEELAKQGLGIFDITPYRTDNERGLEIKEWLNRFGQEVERYIIIDDDTYDIMPYHKGHVVRTSWRKGIKPNAVKMAISMLNK